MKPQGLGVTTFADVFAGIARDQRIYEALTDEERAEVDAHNAKIKGKGITEIIAAGEHPFKRLREKYRSIA